MNRNQSESCERSALDEELFAEICRELNVESSVIIDVRRYLSGDSAMLNMPVEVDPASGLQFLPLPVDLLRVKTIAQAAHHYIARKDEIQPRSNP